MGRDKLAKRKPAPAGKDANRRAPRVFATAPESHAMSHSSPGVHAPIAEAPTRSAPTAQRGLRSKWRDPAKLKLLASLRGDGLLTWEGGQAPMRYELDLFGAGTSRSASGNLEGDFAGLRVDGESPEVAAATLRLADGQEIVVDLSDLQADFAEFHSRDAALDALQP